VKIGLFTDAFLPEISGVTMAVQWFREELEHRGHEAFVYAPRYAGKEPCEERTYRFRAGPVFRYKTARMAIPYCREAYRSFGDLDIVHSHTPFSLAYAAIVAAARHRIPHIQTYHTYLTQYRHYIPRAIRPSAHTTEVYSALLCNRCTTVTVPTEPIRRELERYGVYQPIHVVPLGPHLPLFDLPPCWSPREELGISPATPLCLYAGRLAEEKNLLFLLRAFARIQDDVPEAVLVIAGDGPLRARMEAEVERLGLRGAVRIIGFLDHPRLVDLYREADLFLFASKTETQGLVLVEAMAGATPAVAVGALGVLDVVADGVNGQLVPEDEEQFAHAAVVLLTERDRYAAVSEGAIETARRMSVQSYTDRLLELYEESLRDRRDRSPRRRRRTRRVRLMRRPSTRR